MRKFFHTELMKMTANRKQVFQLFQAIDKHSEKVQRRHYILDSPEDDAALAKLLCETVLGGTVEWPSDDDMYKYVAENEIDTAKWLSTLETEDDDLFASLSEGEDDDNDDDEELEHWKFGECFGISKDGNGHLPLCDADAEAMSDLVLRRSESPDRRSGLCDADARAATDLVLRMSESPDRRPHKKQKEKEKSKRHSSAARQALDASPCKNDKKERRKSRQSSAARQPSEDSLTSKRKRQELKKERKHRSSNAHERPAHDDREEQDADSKKTRIDAAGQPASSNIVAPQRPQTIQSGLEQRRTRTRLTSEQLDRYAAYEVPAAAGIHSRSDTILLQSHDFGFSGRSTHHATWQRVLQPHRIIT